MGAGVQGLAEAPWLTWHAAAAAARGVADGAAG